MPSPLMESVLTTWSAGTRHRYRQLLSSVDGPAPPPKASGTLAGRSVKRSAGWRDVTDMATQAQPARGDFDPTTEQAWAAWTAAAPRPQIRDHVLSKLCGRLTGALMLRRG